MVRTTSASACECAATTAARYRNARQAIVVSPVPGRRLVSAIQAVVFGSEGARPPVRALPQLSPPRFGRACHIRVSRALGRFHRMRTAASAVVRALAAEHGLSLA